MDKIKVMLVEDDHRWLKEISNDLHSELDIDLVKAVSTKAEALEVVRTVPIDIILMDINLTENNLDGIDATIEIKKLKSYIKIIMLTSLTDKDIIVKAIEYGAENYVNKSSINDILKVIREAYHNETSLHQDATGAVLREIRLRSLTPTEKNIYTLKEEGYTRSQIASHFHITIDTIGTHMKNISKKLKKKGHVKE